MEELHLYFEASLERLHSLPGAATLHFAVGGEEKIYLGDHRKPNGAYIENAVDRAMAIYEALPGRPDLLRIDGCPALPFLPPPGEQYRGSCYWGLPKEPPFLRKLLREIIRSELDPAGIEALASGVYFLDACRNVLYFLYDDRGCDVTAPDRETLRPLLDRCGQWLNEP